MVHPSVPANSVQELIAWLKAQPAPPVYGSAGNGTPAHLAAELFAAMTGAPLKQVSYRGAAPALAGLMGGEVKLVFSDLRSRCPICGRQDEGDRHDLDGALGDGSEPADAQ